MKPTRTSRSLLALAAGLALAGLALPVAADGQPVEVGGWTIAPELGVSFHGDYYDDRVITTFEGTDDVKVDRLKIDPDASFRVGVRVERDLSPGIAVLGALAGSWPDAEVTVDGERRAEELEMSVLEVSGGLQLEFLDLIPEFQLPLYAGLEASVVRHGLDDFQWRNQFQDASGLSLGIGGRVGVDYGFAPNVSVRGEIRQSFVRGGYGDLEDEIAEAESRAEGLPADSDFDGNTFSLFSVNAGVAISF